jgi:hypothetical protein
VCVSEGAGDGLNEDKRVREGKGVCVWSSMKHEE